MHPFRCKIPAYGGKLKKEKQEQALSALEWNHPLREGGPLQRAIHQDVMAQYPVFLEALRQAFLDNNNNIEDPLQSSKGRAFQIFKQIFIKAGIALLHTQFTPPRCDAAAYSQLLYSVALDILRQVFLPSAEDTFYSLAAFALFLLYSLYETNPHPSTVKSHVESLPMNLQDCDNPRVIYRRCYREKIRIDAEHYHYLLELRDMCLETVARCQTESHYDDAIPTTIIAYALDTTEVISRLMPHMDYCAYTGPCGLEALAGHGDYPVPPTAATQKWWNVQRDEWMSHNTARIVPVHAQCDDDVYQIPTALQEQMEQYICQRKTIRRHVSSRERHHTKETFLFSNNKTALDTLAFLSRTAAQPETKRVKLRHGFVEVPVAASTRHSVNNTDEADNKDDELSLQESHVHNDDHKEKATSGFHLILPGKLSTVLEESLQDAFETLVQRNSFLPPSAQVTAQPEEVSTLAKSHSTSITGTGRNALRALLQQARPTNAVGLNAFFESHDDADERVPANDALSDISSDEGDKTVACSILVGNSALRHLLSYATKTAPPRENAKKKKKTPAVKRAPRKKPNKQLEQESSEPENGFQEITETIESDSMKSDDSHSSHEDSIIASSSDDSDDGFNEGHAALHALLGRAVV